jgi:glycerate kinase
VLERATGRHERETPGAGAAGGTAFGLLCLAGRFGSLELRPGVDLVMDETDLPVKLARADLVVTGRRIDAEPRSARRRSGSLDGPPLPAWPPSPSVVARTRGIKALAASMSPWSASGDRRP